MDERHKELLRRNRVQLVEDLDPLPLLDYLCAEAILSVDEVGLITALPRRDSQARKLLEILPTRGPKAFDTFCRALERTEVQHHLLIVLKGYKPKVISSDEERVEIMNADGIFVDCPGMVIFDTGNHVATAISGELVKKLNLEDRIDDTDKRSYTGVTRDDDGNPITRQCNTIEIHIKIREMKFPIKALYDVTDGNTDLLIGRDIIDKIYDQDFTLGK